MDTYQKSIYDMHLPLPAASSIDAIFIGFGINLIVGMLPIGISAFDWLIYILAPWIYVVALTAAGATAGKRIVGIQVIGSDGMNPGVRSATKRSFLPFLLSTIPSVVLLSSMITSANLLSSIVAAAVASLVALALWMIDVLWMLGNDRRQTLHDKIGGTMVVENSYAATGRSSQNLSINS
jgi:uncharacterized RDD family membrane protein YckC